ATSALSRSFRGMPPDVRDVVNKRYAKEQATSQFIAGPSERAVVQASVILISGCEDHQLSADGARNGLFTETLKTVWDNGQFTGDYQAFRDAIAASMPASQTPNFATTGADDADFVQEIP